MNKQNIKTLVTTPDIRYRGGISNFTRLLDLNSIKNIDYFEIFSLFRKKGKLFTLRRVLSKSINFFRLIKQYDIVHINTSLGVKSFFRDSVFVVISRLKRKTTIVFWHGWDNELEERIKTNLIYKSIFNFSFGKADHYIVLGEIFKEKLKKLNVRSPNFSLMTPVIDISNDFDLNCKLANKKSVNILFLSRIVKEKGIFIVLDSFQKLLSRIKNIELKLHIVGIGSKFNAMKSHIQKNNIENVVIHGSVSDEKKHEILRNCHILFFPTFYPEGLPAVILECMYYGMPIISRVNAAIPDWVTNGENGFLSDSVDPDEYVKTLETIILNRKLLESISKANHNKAIEFFSVDIIRNKLVKLYNECH